MTTIRTRLTGLAAAVIASIGLVGPVTSDTASAMNPAQTTVAGTVNTVYWNLDAFWRSTLGTNRGYVSPTVNYFNVQYWTPRCGAVSDPQMMAYCATDSSIWVASNVNQSKINRLGDYASGFWLAHEFGHHAAKYLGVSLRTKKGVELYADCLAGVFTRWAYDTRRLDNSDYWEAVATIRDTPYPAEGGANGYPLKADRVAWYQYGFSSYNLAACANASTL